MSQWIHYLNQPTIFTAILERLDWKDIENLLIVDKTTRHYLTTVYRDIVNKKYNAHRNYLTMLNENINNISRVPKSLQTQEICDRAMRYDKKLFKYFAPKFMTEKMCNDLIIKNNDYYYMLQYIPETLKTYALCKKAVEDNRRKNDISGFLRFVPEQFRTQDICVNCDRDEESIKYIPQKHLTDPKFIKRCIDRDVRCVKWFPEQLISDKMYEDILKRCGKNLEMIPHHRQTRDLCEISAKNYGGIEHIAPHLLDAKLIKTAIKCHGSFLSEVPHDLQTEELCRDAVSSYGYAIKDVAPRFINSGTL